jgi:hypothetical protein
MAVTIFFRLLCYKPIAMHVLLCICPCGFSKQNVDLALSKCFVL